MERSTSPRKKLKSPGVDAAANLNIKTSVTCSNVPEGLFDATAAKKHFSKFGRVQRIRLFPKKHMCIIEYDQPISAERAVLNAGAYDGFMFDVGRTKARVRRRSKRDDDPDWVPDSDVEEELSAMSGGPTYNRVSRQKPMEQESEPTNPKTIRKTIKQSPIRSKPPIREKKLVVAQPVSGKQSPVQVVMTQTSLSNSEAAAELHQLRSRVSLSPDEQWRTLDARDRILRAWGGAGSRVKVGGATIGTCPDMCPEKELLHRQAEHQVMTLETVIDSDGQLEPWRAVKQYSRSSADQEMPMCYELRPARVLTRTCLYLLHEVADTTRQVTLADWFHFMWDRFRGIRKDITQQALCCAESIRLVEICARFHAHCAARLADLEHTQFDQKLNTDNLTKCLQTLKHMYADVGPEMKPREAEFRGYIALLNLGDANFWWEIKQLPLEIQKLQAITFAMQIFNALDNNNYVRFFRLVREKATYLQACILLRYFNDVRARALARIVKAYAPRGGSRYPAEELMNSLAFESIENMKSFINHYGLRFGKDESELIVILDRNQFIEDSDPYPISRSMKLIESKRQSTVGEVIAGGQLPSYDAGHSVYSSFNRDGKLKEPALIAEEQGYNTINDSNKNLMALKAEIQRLAQGGRVYSTPERIEPKQNLFVQPETRAISPGKSRMALVVPKKEPSEKKLFSFKPAIPVAPTEVIHNSSEKVFGSDAKNIFSFSKPQDTLGTNSIGGRETGNLFKSTIGVFGSKSASDNDNLFGRVNNENKDPFKIPQNAFKRPEDTNIFKSVVSGKSVFGQISAETKPADPNTNLFGSIAKNVFSAKEDINAGQNTFVNKNIFALAKDSLKTTENSSKLETGANIFAAAATHNDSKPPPNIFAAFSKPNTNTTNLFSKPENAESQPKSFFALNGDATSNKLSPGSLFKSAINVEGTGYKIFPSKNKAQTVADNIFSSVNAAQNNVYEFNQNGEDETEKQLNEQRIIEETERKIQEKIREEEEERKRQEELRVKEQRRQEEQRRLEEQKRQQEEQRRLEEQKQLEEKRKREEERKQEELRKKLEEERKAELKRLAEEEERKFKEKVEKESQELTETLVNEVRDETVTDILTEEREKMKNLMSYANTVTNEICTDLCDEIINSEMKAETFLTEKLMKKWFCVWRKQLSKNTLRRCLLEDTPVWLPEKSPLEEAACLRRQVESAALKNMNAIHRGYKFNGELPQLPTPEPYNIMEIIKSPLLKRMKQINYPYDKCFFWKVTLVSPGEMKWVCRKIEIEKWLLEAFSDKKKHDTSESLIHVQKQSWNHLMDFAISVSLTNNKSSCGEAMEGSNGVLIYATENDHNVIDTIEETLKNKYPYQVIPVAIVMPKTEDLSTYNSVEKTLTNFVNKNIISSFKMYLIDPQNIFDSLYATTKSALKWMAKKYPQNPPLETDYLKSICQRYLGNEIWYRLKSERDGRMNTVLKDLHKLVKCYNAAVDKLTEVITNEELFNYPPFPLEFKKYLDHTTPYPKPYEFIPTNTRNSNNISEIKDMMRKLKLPDPTSGFHPLSVVSMQDQIRKYCNQIGWFENPEEVVCKVVAVLPNEFSDVNMPYEQFRRYFEHYDLLDFLNVMVYEKINQLNNFENRFAVYERSVLENYRNSHWLYEIEVLSKMKHKALEWEQDSLDIAIGAKRRKIELDSMEYLMLEDNDSTMVEENIKAHDESISRYSDCKEAVKQLEKQIDEGRIKSMEFENLLKSALCNV